ncbi:unnamed protein product [Rotaria sordida]|uniref:Gamma-aminobutyric acid receptor subunit beta n=1 Tax=Rotaria sordida TaxID=392033 RepID=A0A818VQT3_9BILA|nr:unnamed protein product [Rotaria sordida]CAF3730678.1 unnamed protein product [Rotaria sordida]
MKLYAGLTILLTIFTLISSANFLRSDSSINTVEDFLDTLINSSHYDRRIRPFFDQHKACNVTMTIHINTISAINEVNMDYNTDLIFRQSWYDPRLNYSGTEWAKRSPEITLHYSLIDRIWVPDSFFRNAKEGKRSDITVPNRLIRIHRDGKVLYSQRLLLKLDCQMKLQKFPLDNQTCVVNIGSYAFGTKDLSFYWDETPNTSAIRVNEDLEMPDFVLSNFEQRYCNRTTATGIRSQLPRVSYIKAIDVWMSACLVFVFAGLLEYALVNVIARKNELKQQVRFSREVIGNRLAQVHFYKKDDTHQTNIETTETLARKTSVTEKNLRSGSITSPLIQNSAISNTTAPSQTPQVILSQQAPVSKTAKPIRDTAQLVDLVSAILFPVAFIVFNIIYWMVYLNMQVEYVLK